MIEKKKFRWKVLFVIMVELVLLGSMVGRCGVKERMENSYVTQEELPLEEKGISLEKGTWVIIVNYITEEMNAYCQAVAETSTGLYCGDKVLLAKSQQQQMIEFELEESTQNFYLCVLSGDEGKNPAVAIDSITVQSTRRMNVRNCFLIFIFFICVDTLFILKRKRVWERLELEQKQVLLGLISIVVIASVPLFVNYLIGEQDTSFHLMRIEGIAEGLRAGDFPVKMQQNWLNGYGYPVSVMYGDLLLYFPALLRCLGFSLQSAYKIYVFFINIITAGISYYTVKHMSGSRKNGLVGAALYTLSIYRLVNIYHRGAVGEYSAMAFFPLVFLGLHLLFDVKKQKKKCAIYCLIIGYTGILQAHCLGFAMIILFSVVYVLFHLKTFWNNLWTLVKTAVVTILLNLFFLVPWIDYMLNQDMLVKREAATNMQEHGIFPAQLFQAFTFGGSLSYPLNKGVAEDMPLTTGSPLLIILALFLWEVMCYRGRLRARNKDYDWREQITLAGMMILALVMSCWFFPWSAVEKIPLIGKVLTVFQFAWRFLAIGTVAGALLSGYVLRNLTYIVSAEWKRTITVVLCVLTCLFAVQMNSFILMRQSANMVTGASAINPVAAVNGGEYLPQDTQIDRLYDTQIYPGEGVELRSAKKQKNCLVISVANESAKESEIVVPYLAYKGYVAIDRKDHKQLQTAVGENAVLKVMLPVGYEGEIAVYFREPVIWRIAEIVSLLTLLLLLWRKGHYLLKTQSSAETIK